MIHRDGYKGPVTFECDVCGNTLDTGEEDFRDAINALKEEAGWTLKKIKDDWLHLCSFDCTKQINRENKPVLPKVHNMERKDAAEWLGLSTASSQDEVKQAYRRIIQLCHPDKGGSDALAKLVNEAYGILRQ